MGWSSTQIRVQDQHPVPGFACWIPCMVMFRQQRTLIKVFYEKSWFWLHLKTKKTHPLSCLNKTLNHRTDHNFSLHPHLAVTDWHNHPFVVHLMNLSQHLLSFSSIYGLHQLLRDISVFLAAKCYSMLAYSWFLVVFIACCNMKRHRESNDKYVKPHILQTICMDRFPGNTTLYQDLPAVNQKEEVQGVFSILLVFQASCNLIAKCGRKTFKT